MIPKKIHYCWFGGNPLPELAVRCIDSWKKYCPDYEIIEWNESNYDITSCDYIKEAYEAKKWAFVSDYARFDILYNYGGVYFDTDVELIKSIDDIVDRGPFMGREPMSEMLEIRGTGIVNSGLGLAAERGMMFFNEILQYYQSEHFVNLNGELNLTTVVERVSKLLYDEGLDISDSKIQFCRGMYIYPVDYFCPLNYYTGELIITENTRSIHHYLATWHDESKKKYQKIQQKLSGLLGEKWGYRVSRAIDFPYRIKNKYKVLGLTGTIEFIKSKYF